jgi:hypothetical protein
MKTIKDLFAELGTEEIRQGDIQAIRLTDLRDHDASADYWGMGIVSKEGESYVSIVLCQPEAKDHAREVALQGVDFTGVLKNGEMPVITL